MKQTPVKRQTKNEMAKSKELIEEEQMDGWTDGWIVEFINFLARKFVVWI